MLRGTGMFYNDIARFMNKIFRSTTLAILPVITLLLGWHIGARFEKQSLINMQENLDFLYSGQVEEGEQITNPEEEIDLSLMWSVWRLLIDHYIDPNKLEVTPMLYGATSGLVRSLGDQYTVFMTPPENDDFRLALDGRLQGIGAELTMRDENVVVVAPLKGSPAALAGLLPEDIIIKVDDVDIIGETLSDVVQKIRGKKGTTITLTIVREGELEPIALEIRRDDITIPSTESEILETATGSIGLITINQFGESTTREVEKEMQEFKGKDLKGIVIDLRYNGGGYLEKAVELTSMFLQQGKVVSVVRRNGEPDNHYVTGRPIDPNIPLVVLINEGSASASEILAGALQDHGRATIIGKTSFGKGTVQEVYELPGGSSIRITTATWITPNGRDLGKQGVDPDIEVERTLQQWKDEVDPQLSAALEWLLDGEKPAMVEVAE